MFIVFRKVRTSCSVCFRARSNLFIYGLYPTYSNKTKIPRFL